MLGWKNGEFVYDPTPAVFDSAEALEKDFVYHDFCGSNLSKYLIKLSKLDGKTLVFLKPCDSYSFNQLLTEHRIKRENVYIIGIPCDGKLDAEKVRDAGAEGILGITTDGDTVKVDTMYGEVSVARRTACWNAAKSARAIRLLFMTKCWAKTEKKIRNPVVSIW